MTGRDILALGALGMVLTLVVVMVPVRQQISEEAKMNWWRALLMLVAIAYVIAYLWTHL